MEFEFTTAKESAVQILKTWNIRLLESFAFNAQQLNEIASVINPGSSPGDKKESKNKSFSKSFRKTKPITKYRQEEPPIRRSGSFSKVQTYRTDINHQAATATSGSAGNSPAVMRNNQGELVRVGGLPPLPQEALDDQYGPNVGGGAGAPSSLSQESYGRSSNGTSPPPLPPRPSDKIRDSFGFSRGGEDPDYAYIKEEEIKTPLNPPRPLDPTASVDEALNELERDIMRDNQARKIEEEDRRRREAKQHRRPDPRFVLGPPVCPPIAEPQDYMDFVPQDYTDFKPSKPQSMSVSSDPESKAPQSTVAHTRSASEPDPVPYQPSSRGQSSQPPVFEDEEMIGLNNNSVMPPLGQATMSKSSHYLPGRSEQAFSAAGPMPSLPPRTCRNSSSSSGNLAGVPHHSSCSLVNTSPSTSLTTMADNRPRTSQGTYNTNPRTLGKSLAYGGSDYAISHLPSISDTHLDSASSTPSAVVAPIQPVTTPPTQSMAILSNHSMTMPPARSTTMPPNFSMTMPPSQSMTTPPAQFMAMPSAQSMNVSPSQSKATPSTASATSMASTSAVSLVGSSKQSEAPSQGMPSTPPPIPPRSPTKEHLSRKSSSSSTSSSSSNRCPHCRGSRRPHKTQVGKTVSLGAALSSNKSHEDCRKSLPDLAGSDNTVLENELKGRGQQGKRSRHCSRCSPESSLETLQDDVGGATTNQTSLSNSTFEYLQLVGEEQSKEEGTGGTRSDMDLMSSCMKYLDFLNREIDVAVSLGTAHNAGTVPGHVVPAIKVTSTSSIPSAAAAISTGTSKFQVNSQASPAQLYKSSSNQAPAAVGKKSVRVEKKSLERNLNRAQLETQMSLASLSQPLYPSPSASMQGVGLLPITTNSDARVSPTPPNGHYGGHPAVYSSHASVTRAGARHQQANGIHSARSVSTTALTSPSTVQTSAPPIVPPRSIVSLKKDPSASTATVLTNKRQLSPRTSSASQLYSQGNSQNRRITAGGQLNHQTPIQNSPRINTRHGSLMRPPRRDHVDGQGQSSTVFIHHLKGGGLAHLV